MNESYLLGAYAIRLHPLAPLYASPSMALSTFQQVINEIKSPNFNPNKEAFELIRQTSLVSLWFFLRYVCSYNGPYERLSDALSIDMCNVRQSDQWERPGAKAVAFFSRGFYKSECSGSRVLTIDGYNVVENIVKGDNLMTRKGWRTVTAVSSSEAPCYKVTLRSGRKIIGADYHAVKTLLDWKPLKELVIGNHVALDLTEAPVGTTIEPSLAYLLGCVYGDGSTTEGSIFITNFDEEVIEALKLAWPNYTHTPKLGRFYIKSGMKLWKHLGLPLQLAINKTYPLLCEGSPEFLRGLFDCDGFVHEDGSYLSLVSASEDLALGAQRNLRRLGIFSSIHKYKTISPHGKCFHVIVSGAHEMKLFKERIGFTVKHKAKRLKRAERKGGPSVRDFTPPEWRSLLPSKTSTIIRDAGIRVDNAYATTREKIRRIGELLDNAKLLEIADDKLIYDKVVSIEPIGLRRVYHIQVEEEHEYESDTGVVNHNSTIFTTGGDTWDLLRNPNERILIVNAGQDKADSFVSIIQSNFSQSSLTAFFFPSHCAFTSKRGQATTGTLIMPNRTKNAQEPSVMSRGVGGGAEGGHFTRINLDDLIGLDDLNQARSASAAMETAKRWVGTNLYALRDGEVSKIGAVTTRFAIDDCYQFMVDSCKTLTGWHKGDIQPTENGEWDVYWRCVEEDGVYLRPDVMSEASLKALIVSDPWSAMTQYYNMPYKTGLAEFVECTIGECKLVNTKDKWAILRIGDNFNPQEAVMLGDCDVVMSIDPAATDTGISAKSCRTSIGIWATDSDDYKYRIWSRVGFFSIHQIIDYIFEGNRVFRGYVRATMIEDNAFQKVIKPLVDREVVNRNVYVHAIGVQARGDKKARIRVALGTYLAKGKIWVTREAGKEFREEVKMFPMSDNRLDVLDESEKGIVFSKRPESPSQRLEREIEEEERDAEPVGAFGYN